MFNFSVKQVNEIKEVLSCPVCFQMMVTPINFGGVKNCCNTCFLAQKGRVSVPSAPMTFIEDQQLLTFLAQPDRLTQALIALIHMLFSSNKLFEETSLDYETLIHELPSFYRVILEEVKINYENRNQGGCITHIKRLFYSETGCFLQVPILLNDGITKNLTEIYPIQTQHVTNSNYYRLNIVAAYLLGQILIFTENRCFVSNTPPHSLLDDSTLTLTMKEWIDSLIRSRCSQITYWAPKISPETRVFAHLMCPPFSTMAGMIGGLKLTAALGYGECAQCAGALGIGLGCFVISSFCCIKCWESYKAKTSRIIAQQHLELSDVRVHTSIAEPDTDPIKRAKQYEVNPFKKVKRD